MSVMAPLVLPTTPAPPKGPTPIGRASPRLGLPGWFTRLVYPVGLPGWFTRLVYPVGLPGWFRLVYPVGLPGWFTRLVYPVGLPGWFTRLVYPVGLPGWFTRLVYPVGLPGWFTRLVYPVGLPGWFTRLVYPVGLPGWFIWEEHYPYRPLSAAPSRLPTHLPQAPAPLPTGTRTVCQESGKPAKPGRRNPRRPGRGMAKVWD